MKLFDKFEDDIDKAIHHIIFNEMELDRQKIIILAPKYFVEMWINHVATDIATVVQDSDYIEISDVGQEIPREIEVTRYKGVKVLYGPVSTMAFVYHEDGAVKGVQPQIINLGA